MTLAVEPVKVRALETGKRARGHIEKFRSLVAERMDPIRLYNVFEKQVQKAEQGDNESAKFVIQTYYGKDFSIFGAEQSLSGNVNILVVNMIGNDDAMTKCNELARLLSPMRSDGSATPVSASETPVDPTPGIKIDPDRGGP